MKTTWMRHSSQRQIPPGRGGGEGRGSGQRGEREESGVDATHLFRSYHQLPGERVLDNMQRSSYSLDRISMLLSIEFQC
jgi:hypothetical protein